MNSLVASWSPARTFCTRACKDSWSAITRSSVFDYCPDPDYAPNDRGRTQNLLPTARGHQRSAESRAPPVRLSLHCSSYGMADRPRDGRDATRGPVSPRRIYDKDQGRQDRSTMKMTQVVTGHLFLCGLAAILAMPSGAKACDECNAV